jgi:CRP/FNR family transcriptional regulator, cyclic AMP receptor protein
MSSVKNRRQHITKALPGTIAPFDPKAFFAALTTGRSHQTFRIRQKVFSQGDAADSLYYIDAGRVRMTVTSAEGKQRTIGMLNVGDFFGEGCLAGQPLQIATASALSASGITRISKQVMIHLLHTNVTLADAFTAFLLTRNAQIQDDLIDQLFNSSERRLARVLLLLANFGKEANFDVVIPKVSQELLAQRVGTSRARINKFMNKFRKLGYIEYNGTLKVHRSLVNVLIHDN